MPTVAVTGANGFIGSHLVRHFAGRGWPVIALGRSAPPGDLGSNVSHRPYALTEPPQPDDLAGGDYLVHCAYAKHTRRGPDSDEINVRGTKLLLDAARRQHYKKFVFLSSLSAHESAGSHYGRHKFALEAVFDPRQDLVLRLGLTLGDGGLVQSIARVIEHLHLVPLIGGGQQRLYTVGMEDVCRGIETLLSKGAAGKYVLAAPEPVTMRAFYAGIARQLGVRCAFLPLPFSPVYGALALAESVGLPLPVTTENLLGLRQMRAIDPAMDLRAFGVFPRPFEDAVRCLARGSR